MRRKSVSDIDPVGSSEFFAELDTEGWVDTCAGQEGGSGQRRIGTVRFRGGTFVERQQSPQRFGNRHGPGKAASDFFRQRGNQPIRQAALTFPRVAVASHCQQADEDVFEVLRDRRMALLRVQF